MAPDEFLVFGSPLIEQAEIDEVVDSLRSGWLGAGPKVKRFEEMFAHYKHTQFAIALNSCTAALHLSLLAIGIAPGDEVIVPTMTFAATSNAVIHAGGRPVFADCETDTMNIDPRDVERKITPLTKAIVPVHFAGRPCDMDAILRIARDHNLLIIEDCAHALEAEYHGRKVGTFGAAGCFSFYVTKNIVTGEGGMIATDDATLAGKIKVLALHGLTADAWRRFSDRGFSHYQVIHAGFKYNMMDLQAAIGLHQLPRVERYWERRREIWHRYNDAFADLPARVPVDPDKDTKHAFHLYTLLLDTPLLKFTRDEFLQRMTKAKIGVGVHYIALHLHPFYQQSYGYRSGQFPNAETISRRTVSLPLGPKLTDDDVGRVIETTRWLLTAGIS